MRLQRTSRTQVTRHKRIAHRLTDQGHSRHAECATLRARPDLNGSGSWEYKGRIPESRRPCLIFVNDDEGPGNISQDRQESPDILAVSMRLIRGPRGQEIGCGPRTKLSHASPTTRSGLAAIRLRARFPGRLAPSETNAPADFCNKIGPSRRHEDGRFLTIAKVLGASHRRSIWYPESLCPLTEVLRSSHRRHSYAWPRDMPTSANSAFQTIIDERRSIPPSPACNSSKAVNRNASPVITSHRPSFFCTLSYAASPASRC